MTFTAMYRLAFNELVQHIFTYPLLAQCCIIFLYLYFSYYERNEFPLKSMVPMSGMSFVHVSEIIIYIVCQFGSGGHAQCTKITSSLNFRAFYTMAQSLRVLNHTFFSEWHVQISPISAHTSPLESPAFSIAWMPMCSPLFNNNRGFTPDLVVAIYMLITIVLRTTSS